MIISNKLLYGTDHVPPIRKEDADARIEMLKLNLEREMSKPTMCQNNFIQYEILRAIKFWQKMSNQEDTGL